jgi:hypothetical protein
MTKYRRIVITFVSCLALSILGVQGVASAQPMAPQGHDWCC